MRPLIPRPSGALTSQRKRRSSSSSTNLVEERSDWARDVTGHSKISAPDFAKSLNLDASLDPRASSLKMKIVLANYSLHTRVGRQYFALMDFGSKITGCMRCSPSCDSLRSVTAGVLEPGLWAGKSPECIRNVTSNGERNTTLPQVFGVKYHWCHWMALTKP